VAEAREEEWPLITMAKKSDNLLNHCATNSFYRMYLYSEIDYAFGTFL
jgi:hypothetical protein